jgi:23S rRNA (cytosine1962-C5)-methyltransferase
MKTITLKPGREKSLLRRHPWIFSGAIARVEGTPAPGDTVQILSAQGAFLAHAAYNAHSQITARVWSWQQSEPIDADFFHRQISRALAARVTLGRTPGFPRFTAQANQGIRAQRSYAASDASAKNSPAGQRLIHSESDGLPGLVVDQYSDVLVMQIGSAGAERWRDTCADILQQLCRPTCIYERSDSDVRGLEGLPPRTGVLRGDVLPSILIEEHGVRFAVDVAHGQKTGFYLDQRDNRALIGALAQDKEVLNCFCYSGGFTLHSLHGGAKSVLSIDASEDALQLAQRNLGLNELEHSRAEWQCADVFAALRLLRDQNRKFDLIILDPPKFAPTAAFAEKAARGYKDINLLGFKLLRPGGILATFSCSGGINDDLFQKIIAGAALDAGVDAQILYRLHAAADHPVLLSFPEGAYLKGLVLSVSN